MIRRKPRDQVDETRQADDVERAPTLYPGVMMKASADPVEGDPRPLGVLVIAATFPSRIQPWLLTQLVQICKRGGAVHIVADRPAGDSYPSAVDEWGLLERTHYHPVVPLRHTLGGLAHLLLPTRAGRDIRGGLRRLRESSWTPEGWKEWVKSSVRAPVLQLGVDLVHGHSMSLTYEYSHVAEILGIPLVMTFHGQTPKGVRVLSRAKRDRLFDRVDIALVNTRFARRQLEALGCPGEKIRILPQGIQLSEYPFEPAAFPSTGGAVRLLTVGRLQPDKGLRYAISAVGELVSRGYVVDYTIVGGGPEEAALRSQVETLGLAGVVHLAGRVDDAALGDLYRRSHVFILPSVGNDLEDHTETQGVVIQEAQASGVIVTASRVGGIPECVDEGRSAFLFEDRNPGAIANAVANVIDHPEDWRRWQDAGRSWVEERFDVEVLGERLWALYASILAHRTEV